MKRLVLTATLGLLCHACLIECKGIPIKGSKSENLRQPQLFTNNVSKRQLGVGPRPVDDNGAKDGKGKGDKGDFTNEDIIDDGRDGSTGGDPIVLDLTSSPTDHPSMLPTTMTVASPTALPTDAPSASPSVVSPTILPTDAPSELPSVSTILAETSTPTDISSSTSSPTNMGTNIGIIARSLLPFDITVQGEESELQMVQIPLELSVNEFLSGKMDDSFESFKDITLSTTELGVIQRQTARKSFGFSGDAKFYDRNVPTTEEVQDVQRRALADFSFELQGILNERNVSVNVVDILVDDDDDEDSNQNDGDDEDDGGGDGDGGDNSEDTSSARGGIQLEGDNEPPDSTPVAIGVGVGVAVVILLCALLLYLRQRKQRIEDNKELNLLDDPDFMDDPDLDVDAPVDYMIDTSAAAQSQPVATEGEYV